MLRFLFLLMFGLLGLQPIAYAYDAVNFLSSAGQWTCVPTAYNQAAAVESAAAVPLCPDHARAASASQANLRPAANFIAAESETMTTVLGSGRDVAAYAGKPGFNVLDMSSVPEQEWARTNAEWLNSAMQRGDNIWLVTDPAAHAQLMQQLGKSSYYLDLELPMLEEFNASPVIKYAVPPGH
jgi:hypothetical protein